MAQQSSSSNVRRNPNVQGNSSGKKKKKKPKFRLSFVFFIFFIVYVTSFFAYMIQANATNKIPTKEDSVFSNVSSDEEVTTEVTTVTTEEEIISATNNPVPESDPVDEEYLNSCLFIGDSISTGFSGYFFLDEENVLAKNGLNPVKLSTEMIEYQGEEMLAIDGVIKSGFKNIYIMLGSNGVGWASNESMVDGYRDFINEIKEKVEDANIYIVSVPPVTSMREDTNEYATIEDGLVYNSTIDELNELYLNLANEMDVHYLDINSYLKDGTGKLPFNSSTDGMHFDSATYQKILDYVCSHVAE